MARGAIVKTQEVKSQLKQMGLMKLKLLCLFIDDIFFVAAIFTVPDFNFSPFLVHVYCCSLGS